MYNRFNFKTADTKIINTDKTVQDITDAIPSTVKKVLNDTRAPDVDIPEIGEGSKVRLDTPIATTASNEKLNVVDLPKTNTGNAKVKEPDSDTVKSIDQKPSDFDWKRLINFNDPYFQYYTMPTALGLGIGGMFGGWKGALLGGLGSFATGALAKYLGENYDMTPKSSAPATQTTSPAAPVSTSNIA